jgi:hypothetical protein
MAHQTDPEDFICDLCGKEFNSVSDLDEHKAEHRRHALAHDEKQRDIRRDIGAAGLPGSPLQ